MPKISLLPLCAASVRHWLRGLLLCAAFSALHVPLGAWVVSAASDGPVVQICTPQGLQWIGLVGDEQGPEHQAAPLQPCVWAAAHVAIGPSVWCVVAAVTSAQAVVPRLYGVAAVPNDRIRRVLLMAAMRAPPDAFGTASQTILSDPHTRLTHEKHLHPSRRIPGHRRPARCLRRRRCAR